MNDSEPRLPPVIVLAEPSSPWSVPPGWHVHHGFTLPGQPWDLRARQLICHGPISDEANVVAAVTALTRGTGLAVSLDIAGDLRFRLLEDLHQLGVVTQPDVTDEHGLDDDHRLLIEALVVGASVTDAAHHLNMSRRTANRRLIEIRATLGVETNAEAIIWWAERHGSGRPKR